MKANLCILSRPGAVLGLLLSLPTLHSAQPGADVAGKDPEGFPRPAGLVRTFADFSENTRIRTETARYDTARRISDLITTYLDQVKSDDWEMVSRYQNGNGADLMAIIAWKKAPKQTEVRFYAQKNGSTKLWVRQFTYFPDSKPAPAPAKVASAPTAPARPASPITPRSTTASSPAPQAPAPVESAPTVASAESSGTPAPAVQTSAAPAPAPADPGSSGSPAGLSGNGITGVWMGFKFLPASGSYEPQPRWVVFFNDGQAFQDLPNTGLANFDRQASQADADRAPYWGTWSMQGGNGEFRSAGSGAITTIAVVDNRSIKLDSDTFYRSASVDGLRLDGSWTSYADPNDPSLIARPDHQSH